MSTVSMARRAPVAAEERGPTTRAVPWLSVVLPLAVLLALADEFWVVVLRTSVGSIERTSAPALSWLRESVELLPVYVVAVVAALAVACRWWGDRPRGRGPVLGTIVLVALAAAVAAGTILLASSLWDYHLQSLALVHHVEDHGGCDSACLAARESASLAVQLRAVAVGFALILATDLALVAWAVALRGGPLPAAVRRRGATATEARPAVLALALLLVGSGLVHAAVVPEHLDEWWAAGVFFVVVLLAQLASALWVWRRPGRAALVTAAVGSAALLVLWAVSRAVGLPLGPEAGEPEAVGLADLCAGVLELAAVLLCVALLRTGPEARPGARRSPHLRGIVLAGIVALTVLGIGGSTLPGVDLLSGTGGHAEVDAGDGAEGTGATD
ncbi:hypothetical protein [Nocardioides okcheonensis]|uniref:hypothetical protein n=1 Tax=Nocardioides okcheonensis TaxID=2894081 RepID=UPI001E37EB86|nr:hypothetical protein [Nocardioides okcheonensis]UFN43879.1 hypothetical protein LN652_17800 [Nocardioides okcheonensis]